MNQLDGAMHVMEGVVRDLEDTVQTFEIDAKHHRDHSSESVAHLLLGLVERLSANKPMSKETGDRFRALTNKLREASDALKE